ncbi:glucose 1-dehydrogenase [Dyadobacter jejuensis]|uniref:Glucose 1-dehydrogenase n=1 Tax=Dyadobacter jejuensis TaxID=1082580 RepID=A0A316APJ1_9BACT|nr:SDR family oxidoreductase [Dyadobacter jejuensis]PWJ59054.1 glucose 1-dehydrogenase [Dyadobacter jejuensis]
MNQNTLSLSGQVAVVTGSSSGIGRACAIYLAALGAKIVVNYASNREEGQETVDHILQQGGAAHLVQADVSKEQDVQNLFLEAIQHYGRVDILVNNAGLQKDAPFLEMTLAQWERVIGVNLTGQFLCAREAARLFIKQAEADPKAAIGKMVMMSSVHDIIPWAGHVNYAASKGGVHMLMKTLSQELAPYKIRVNAVSPGAIQTSINEAVWSDPEKYQELLKLIPYKRIGTAEDVAKAVAWLCSDESDYVNGETMYIDGGMTLYPEFADNG